MLSRVTNDQLMLSLSPDADRDNPALGIVCRARR
jgi:hypothetical protein